MADFKPKKLDLTQINGGKEYEDRQGIQPIAINAPIEASAWVQMLAETQPDTSEANNIGTPSVSIEYDTNGYPYFKFANLKGETGTAEGEIFLTKTEADENYLSKAEVASEADVKGQSSTYAPITPARLSYATVIGLTENKLALTNEQKYLAQTWLGVKKYYTHALIFHKSGSLNFTVDIITSEATAYLNCTTPMADNLFCTNSKSIVLNGINDPSGVKSGVGTLMATMTPYADENGENSGVKLSGVWINYATGEVSQVSNFEVPFEQDIVTEL